MKKILLLLIITFSLYGLAEIFPSFSQTSAGQNTNHDRALVNAFENWQSNVQVQGSGTVVKNLADDTHGSRHQKFILRMASGHTLLIVHNIDLASRINGLSKGDTVHFYGEYEWNSKGGIVHWTHHDPGHHHIDGWLKHKGKTFQ
ncbi:DUF3465 domain-containing protein [Thiomicrorhabdus arctica]|uniref:DUF3465 domain-containing protein n=1 Tax=Thiomicrorhabdus arctica TaxID=131540 RepID=UPI00036CAD5C|nr:DUF3465 domain-containing protein [Thiomicrorhabdus arctica]